MSTRNYESSHYIDIHKLRKNAAKATGFHHHFSKKKMRAPPAAAEEVIQEHEEEETMKKVCQETRLDDLSERIPPLATLLSEMTANNDVSTREIADELAMELEVWKLRLEEAIEEFEIDTAACTRSEQQLERLGELNELLCSSIEAHNKRPKSASPAPAASETELIRFSSFAGGELGSSAVEPTSLVVAVDAIVDPFQSRFDPFGVGEQDARSKVVSPCHQGEAQQQTQQTQQTQQMQQMQQMQQTQMQVAAPATGFTDPFAPYREQDPFMHAQQMQQMLPQRAQQMQQMQPQPAQQMQQMQVQQALSVQKKEPKKAFQVSQFDPFAPIQQSA